MNGLSVLTPEQFFPSQYDVEQYYKWKRKHNLKSDVLEDNK